MSMTALLDAIKQAVITTIPQKNIGIAFSGGVDSTLVAKICTDLGYNVTLLTIGFPESHDILFAKQVNEYLKLPHNVLEINSKYFSRVISYIHNVINTENLSWNENCIAFYYVSELAKSLDIKIVVTANGIDELFCGYNAYRNAILLGEDEVNRLMDYKLENEQNMMKAVNLVASQFGVKILQPLLSENFIKFSKSVPIIEKIHDADDLMRKHAIRQLAFEIGLPEFVANKRKKALQYGSKIHKHLLKTR